MANDPKNNRRKTRAHPDVNTPEGRDLADAMSCRVEDTISGRNVPMSKWLKRFRAAEDPDEDAMALAEAQIARSLKQDNDKREAQKKGLDNEFPGLGQTTPDNPAGAQRGTNIKRTSTRTQPRGDGGAGTPPKDSPPKK